MAGFVDACQAAGVAAFGPDRRGGAARGLQGLRQGGHGGRGRADRRLHGRAPTSRPGSRAIAALPRRAQGRRARGGQGRGDRGRRGRGARDARGDARRACASATCRSWSRSSWRASSCPCSRCATARPRSRSPRRATSSASARATPAPTRAAWARYSPVDGADAALIEDVRVRVLQPVVDELARRGTPFHGVLYAGPDAHRGRAEGARVQRPLRRSRDPGGAAAAAQRPARPAAARGRARRAGGRRARVGRAGGGDRRARLARLSRVVVVGRRDQRPRRRLAGARSPTPGTAERDGDDRHRGRPGAERDRARRGPRSRPGRPRMLPRT